MQLIIGSQVTLIDGKIQKLFPYGKVLELLSKFKNICNDIHWNVNVPQRDNCQIIDNQEEIKIKNYYPLTLLHLVELDVIFARLTSPLIMHPKLII